MLVSFIYHNDTIIVSLCQENILFFLNFYWNKKFYFDERSELMLYNNGSKNNYRLDAFSIYKF